MGHETPGYKQFGCWASASPSCNTPDLAWTKQSISGVTITWTPSPPVGGNVTIKLQNLPSLNSKFGQHWVKASVDGKYAYGYYRLFFMPNNTDHPASLSPPDDLRDGTEPNWFCYWKETTAYYGDGIHWSENLDRDPSGRVIWGVTDWVTPQFGGSESWLGPHVVDEGTDGSQLPQEIADGPAGGCFWKGIDLYGHAVRHEARHREVFAQPNWWPNGFERYRDTDEGVGDLIPDDVEPALLDPEHGVPYDPARQDTDGDSVIDNEDYIFWTQSQYDWGGAHSADWSRKGFQYNQ
jgi:hypothetical protein